MTTRATDPLTGTVDVPLRAVVEAAAALHGAAYFVMGDADHNDLWKYLFGKSRELLAASLPDFDPEDWDEFEERPVRVEFECRSDEIRADLLDADKPYSNVGNLREYARRCRVAGSLNAPSPFWEE